MIDNIKLGGKIMAKAYFKWALIAVTGTFFTFLYFCLGLYVSWGYLSSLSSGPGMPSVGQICAILLVIGFPIFLILYSKLAMSTTIDTAIYQLWNSNAGIYVTEKVESVLNSITEKEGWRKEFSDGAISKVKLLNSIQNDSQCPKKLKKVIKYGVNLINLDDVNFNDENLKLTDVVMTKFNSAANEIEKPSLKSFWLLLLLQTALMIVAFVLR